ncbi:MAG: amidohydrolase family protein [Bryobacteraceae bacterium]|nr:amidohydrolase family protein [Bryobacteraceae bacterium]
MADVNRRNFLKASLATPAAAGASMSAAAPAQSDGLIDTHVYLSRWPGRRLIGDETEELVRSLKEAGVAEGWAGSFDALLHKDIAAVNARVAAECSRRGGGVLKPVGAVNPTLPDWEDDVRRCQEEFRMPAIRLHPNYHNYTLADPAVARLFPLAAERRLTIQIAAWMEDERTQFPLLQVPIVDLEPLPGLMEKTPEAKVMVLNGFISVRGIERLLPRLKTLGNLAFDIAMLEQMLGVRVLIDAVGVERVIFGSYSPMFYLESALLKLRESVLTATELAAVRNGNAKRLAAGS